MRKDCISDVKNSFQYVFIRCYHVKTRRHVRDRWRPQPAIMGMPIPLLPVVRDCSHEVKGTTMRGTGKNLNNPEKLAGGS
jgi:hypothetical protein